LDLNAAKDPNFALKGTTLRVYMHMFHKGKDEPSGIREIQRALNFSSPTLAKYHLEKLQELGLVKQNEDGSYSLVKEVKVDVLEPFVKLGSFIIPRLIGYAVTISILFAYFVVSVLPSGNLAFIEFYAVVIGRDSSFLALVRNFEVLENRSKVERIFCSAASAT
jgi:DNA-binding transcriptional ArsR family regulator